MRILVASNSRLLAPRGGAAFRMTCGPMTLESAMAEAGRLLKRTGSALGLLLGLERPAVQVRGISLEDPTGRAERPGIARQTPSLLPLDLAANRLL